jgi:hypothetical protein
MNHPLTLGDSVLDEDHLRLEDLVLQLRDAPLDEVSRRLEAVREHASGVDLFSLSKVTVGDRALA